MTVAYTPVRLPRPEWSPLELRVTAPACGNNIPVVVLSHGFGPSNYIPSKDGYAHLAQFWAERGLAVIQPTHASSRVGGQSADAPGAPFFWRERVGEITTIIDQLESIEAQAPALAGRLDREKIAVAGHSFGGHTCSLLLGASLENEDFRDERISAGLLLTTPGRGGADLTPENRDRFPFFDLDFGSLTTRTMVVCGSADNPRFTDRGPEWHADPYHLAPGGEALLTIKGAGHGLGGISGLDAKETETEDPDMLEATKRLTLAWLRHALGLTPSTWDAACASLDGEAAPLASVEMR